MAIYPDTTKGKVPFIIFFINSILCFPKLFRSALQWRHNECDGVSNHQHHDSLFNRLFRRRSTITPKLRVTGFVRGIHRWPVNSPHIGPVTRKTFPFDDVIIRVCCCSEHNSTGIRFRSEHSCIACLWNGTWHDNSLSDKWWCGMKVTPRIFH